MNRSKTRTALLARGIDSELANEIIEKGYTVQKLKAATTSELQGVFDAQIASLIKDCITRKPVPSRIVTRLLTDTDSRCCLCWDYGKETPIILHHIEEYRTSRDNREDNLVVVCPNHHADIHTIPEISHHRWPPDVLRQKKKQWIAAIKAWKAGQGPKPGAESSPEKDEPYIAPYALDRFKTYAQKEIQRYKTWETRYEPLYAKGVELQIMAARRIRGEATGAQGPLLHIISRSPRLVIVGKAGTGKTTTLRRAVVDAAHNVVARKGAPKVPALIELRDYRGADIDDLFMTNFTTTNLNRNTLESYLKHGRFFIVFDGLNEVSPSLREGCLTDLRRFLNDYPDNRYLLTSRPEYYSRMDLEIKAETPPVFEILPLGREQIERFVKRYFARDKESADRLISELGLTDDEAWEDSSALVQLARIPLMLWMFIRTYEEIGSIPRNRGALLRSFVSYILERHEPARRAGYYRPEVKRSIMAHLGRRMLDKGRFGTIHQDWAHREASGKLEQLKEMGQADRSYAFPDIWREIITNNLIQEEADSVFWIHQLIQQFFAAVELRSDSVALDGAISKEALYQCLAAPIGVQSPWWDPIKLMVGTLPEDFRVPALLSIACVNHDLAFDCFQEFETESQGMIEGTLIDELLDVATNGDTSSPQEKVNATKTIEHFHIKQSCNAAHRIALESPVPNARKEALRILWKLREFGSPSQTTAECIRKDDDQTVRAVACGFISSLRHRWVTELLLDSLLTDSQYVATRVSPLLASRVRYKWVVDTLLETAADPDNGLACWRAIWAIGVYGVRTPMAIDVVSRAATDYDDPSLRRLAVDTLPKIGNDQSVPVLRKATDDTHRNVRLAAMSAICRFPDSEVLDDLISRLDDVEEDVAIRASDLLVELDGNEVVERLRAKVRDREINRRDLAVRTIAGLVKKGDSRVARNASNALETFSNDSQEIVRYHAAVGLRLYRPELSAKLFKDLRHSSDPLVKDQVTDTLKEWGELV